MPELAVHMAVREAVTMAATWVLLDRVDRLIYEPREDSSVETLATDT